MGGRNPISAVGTGRLDEASGTGSAGSARDRLVRNFAAPRNHQKSRECSAKVAGTRQRKEIWGKEKFSEAALWEEFADLR